MSNGEDRRIIITKAEPAAWLERMEVFRGERWLTVADQLRREREEWDHRLGDYFSRPLANAAGRL